MATLAGAKNVTKKTIKLITSRRKDGKILRKNTASQKNNIKIWNKNKKAYVLLVGRNLKIGGRTGLLLSITATPLAQ
jgi:hypothetical protein